MEMFCHDFRLLASRRADHDLTQEEIEKLSAHLARCRHCRERDAEFLALKRLLKNTEQKGATVGMGLHKGRKRHLSRVGLGLAAALLLGLGGFFIFRPFTVKQGGEYAVSALDDAASSPLVSLIYYEEKPSSGYIENYYTPMSTYFLLIDEE